MNKFKAVIFDIDGTLTNEISWITLTEKLGGSVEEHKKIHVEMVKGELSLEDATTQLLTMWKATGNANEKFITSVLKGIKLRDEVIPLIGYLKSRGYIVCLITGATEMYAKILAEHLGIDWYYGNTPFFFDNNGNLLTYQHNPKQAELKTEQLVDFCEKNSFKPRECVPIGDSDNDMGLFETTGNGIAIRTKFEDKVLEAIAWKVIDNLSQLKEIL